MNKDKRARLHMMAVALRENGRKSIEDAVNEVESIINEEQESYDNLPAGLQSGSRGESIQEAIETLEEIKDNLQSVDEDTNDDTAKEVCDNAADDMEAV